MKFVLRFASKWNEVVFFEGTQPSPDLYFVFVYRNCGTILGCTEYDITVDFVCICPPLDLSWSALKFQKFCVDQAYSREYISEQNSQAFTNCNLTEDLNP